ncbi:MAG: leucine-rich repeat protein [Candidatus Ornithomonoglobus sp.]
MKKILGLTVAIIIMFVTVMPNSMYQKVYASGTADDIVNIAKGEVGYCETGTNITKYWADLDSSMQGQSWCAAFIVWCARKAGIGSDIIPTSYSAYDADNSMKNWFSARGRYYLRGTTTPQKGDLIIFKYSDGSKHIGLVSNSDNTNVYTIEGNKSDKVCTQTYTLTNSTIDGYCRPAYAASQAPDNVSLTKNQYWYDIKDTIELTPHANNATGYYMSVCRKDNNQCVVGTSLSGTYSFSASSVGYGNYYAWITATNSAGGTDSAAIEFSVVGAPTYGTVWTDKKIFTTSETIWISVSSVCAKGHVIGIDKIETGRVITESCDSSYGIEASKLGVGSYSAYFSVYNGSGSIDTSRVEFEIIDPVNYGDDFYAFIKNNKSGKMITNNNPNVILQGEIPSDNQKWHFVRQSDGSYKISSLKDEKCLDVESASSDAGANVKVETDNGSTAQKWYLIKQGGNICLAAACTTCRLDISGGIFEDGINIQMYTSNNSDAQFFTIYVISDKIPQYANLYTDKEVYKVGETIKFSARSDYATGFWIAVYRDGNRIIDAEKIPSEYSVSFDKAGSYMAYISAANSAGGIDSSKIYFSVVDSIPTSTPTVKPTATPTPTPTATPTPKPTAAPTPTPTATPTTTPTPSPIPTASPTPTSTPTPTPAPTQNPDISASGTCGENLKWELSYSGVLTISGTGSMEDIVFCDLPWYDLRLSVEKVDIKEGVTSITPQAFTDCINMISIDIPSTVTCIGFNAFCSCSSLTDINVSESNRSYISDNGVLFSYDKAKLVAFPPGQEGEYEIPSGVDTIGCSAFYDCDKLTDIIIPDTVSVIEDEAFLDCDGIRSITIPKGVEEIGPGAFNACTGLTDIYYEGSRTDWESITIGAYNEYLENITIHYADDIPEAGAVIAAAKISACPGDIVEIPVTITGNPGIAAFSVSMSYDNTKLTPQSISLGDALTGSIISNIQQTGVDLNSLDKVTAVWSSESDNANDGTLYIVTFKVSDDAEEGETIPISLSYNEGDISNQSFEDITVNMTNGGITVESGILYGDIFADGKINSKDLVKLKQYIALWNVTLDSAELKAADVFPDGKINAKDVVKLQQYIAGWDVKLGE